MPFLSYCCNCGPKSCCHKFCRFDKAVHQGRFSAGAYRLAQPAFSAVFPQGMKLPVDGVPTNEGPLSTEPDLLGFHQVPRSSFRDFYNLDWEETQQLASHDDWMLATPSIMQVPDIDLDWSSTEFNSCVKSAGIVLPFTEKLTTYGTDVPYYTQQSTNFTDVLASPGIFFYTRQEVRAVTANFYQAHGDYSVGAHTVNVVVSYNGDIGSVASPILSVPHTAYGRYVDLLSGIWQGPGHPTSPSNFSKPARTTDWSPRYSTGGFVNTSAAFSPMRRLQVGFNFEFFLPTKRANLHADFSGDEFEGPAWTHRTVRETERASTVGTVVNGVADLRTSFGGTLNTSGRAYLPQYVSKDPFVPDGRKQYDPFNLFDHRDTNLTPKLQLYNSSSSVVADIDIATELPEFINSDPTIGVYGVAVWPFPGDKTNNDLYTGAGNWECQFNDLQARGGGANTYYGGFGYTHYMGSEKVYWQTAPWDPPERIEAFGRPRETNAEPETFIAGVKQVSEEIPRATWKANADFCVPLSDGSQTITQSHDEGHVDIDGVIYQGAGAFTRPQVDAIGPSDSQFCRLRALPQLSLSIANAQYFDDIEVVQLDLTAQNNTSDAIPEGATVQTTPFFGTPDFGPIAANGSATITLGWGPPQSEKDSRVFNLQVQASTNDGGSDVTDFVIDLN